MYHSDFFTEETFITAQTTDEESEQNEKLIVPVKVIDNQESILESTKSEVAGATLFYIHEQAFPVIVSKEWKPILVTARIQATTTATNTSVTVSKDPKPILVPTATDNTATAISNDLEFMMDPLFAKSQVSILELKTPLKIRNNKGAPCSSRFTVSPKIIEKRYLKRDSTSTKLSSSLRYFFNKILIHSVNVSFR